MGFIVRTTDQIGNSTTLILPKNKCESMCVARQLKAYLKFRPNIDGQLFCHLNHKKLTRSINDDPIIQMIFKCPANDLTLI
jgi:hypothetical protein